LRNLFVEGLIAEITKELENLKELKNEMKKVKDMPQSFMIFIIAVKEFLKK